MSKKLKRGLIILLCVNLLGLVFFVVAFDSVDRSTIQSIEVLERDIEDLTRTNEYLRDDISKISSDLTALKDDFNVITNRQGVGSTKE